MKQKIIELLKQSGGEPISGEEISSQLQVSRTAVWKHINSLKKEGYQIESKSRVGYVLTQTPDILYPPELKLKLADSLFSKNLVYEREVDSTNKLAKKIADQGAEEGTVVLTEKQTLGRGRRGRSWHSADEKGIWMSVVIRPQLPPVEAPKFTFVAAVAVISAIKNVTGLTLGIKWPNDILFEGKKVCGILTEMKAEIDVIDYVIIGIGINVNHESSDFPDELEDIASSLRIISGQTQERQKLAVEILIQLEKWYELFARSGFDIVLNEWKKWDLTIGQQVTVRELKKTYEGCAIDIDKGGNLLVDVGGVVTSVMSGDVSIRIQKTSIIT